MEEITFYVKLKAKCLDIGGYIIYVFENLDYKDWEYKHIMCTQFPNWNQSDIQIGDIGYVSVRYVKEGSSQWFDGEKMNYYKQTQVMFLKFIKEPEKLNNEYIVD